MSSDKQSNRPQKYPPPFQNSAMGKRQHRDPLPLQCPTWSDTVIAPCGALLSTSPPSHPLGRQTCDHLCVSSSACRVSRLSPCIIVMPGSDPTLLRDTQKVVTGRARAQTDLVLRGLRPPQASSSSPTHTLQLTSASTASPALCSAPGNLHRVGQDVHHQYRVGQRVWRQEAEAQ